MAPYAPLDPPKILSQPRKKVDYFYDVDIGNYAYASGHPMKQHRARLAHSLVMNYDLYTKMSIFRAKPASKEEMTQFHAEDYVDFLAKVTHDNLGSMNKEQMRFNVGDDCPVFDGLFQYCGISAGGSMEGAARLGKGKCDIAVNWAGGLHHAKKSEASGFCYVNDIVLAIIELLRYHNRVLYIDIDVHHGDGVEEAFYTTDRVMTVSFHQYGEFFPGTGELGDIGADKGRNYSINFPLRQGIDDASYKNIFESVMSKVMEHYQPGAVVLQCGGDSLAGDKLGSLNLSMRGHANCVSFMKSFGVPLLILGGGGYTMRNVSRTWAYETGLAVGVDLPEEIPLHEYSEYYAPDYTLDVKASDMPDQNTVEYLEKIKIKIFELLKDTTFVPSVQQQDVGDTSLAMDADMEDELDDADEDDNKDVRDTQRRADQRIEVEGELMDSDDEGDPAPISNRDADESKVPSETDDAMDVEEANGNAPEANGSTNGDVEMRDEGEDEHVNGNGADAVEASKSPQAREEEKGSE